MKNSFPFLFLMMVFVFLGVSCVPVSVTQVDRDSKTDFLQYKTYQFKEFGLINKTALEPQMENINKLTLAIQRELDAKGLVESDTPDLLVNLGIFLTEGVTTRETTLQDAPRYIGQRNYHWESEEIVVNRYEEGSVVVDLIDVEKNRLVWEGIAKGVITANQAKMEKRINLAMKKLFERYP